MTPEVILDELLRLMREDQGGGDPFQVPAEIRPQLLESIRQMNEARPLGPGDLEELANGERGEVATEYGDLPGFSEFDDLLDQVFNDG